MDKDKQAVGLRQAKASLKRAAQAAAGFPPEKRDGKRWRAALARVKNAQDRVDLQKELLERDSPP
jgi:hypothetical protein